MAWVRRDGWCGGAGKADKAAQFGPSLVAGVGVAEAVQQHFDADAPPSLNASEQLMLKRLACGAPTADLATELGYSERSMYRELSKLWDKLGVSGRAAGLQKATAEGLID